MKRPAFQFYPADWRKDAALQSCSLAAQGLWVNLLCIAHECEPYGHLTINGRPMNAAQIARLVGLTAKDCEKLLAELRDAGVSSASEDGALFSRRMVRDEDIRNRRAEGGKAGSEHGIKGAEHGAKGGRPAKGRGVSEPPLEPPLKPPPSSSSSTSVEISGAKAPSSAEPTWKRRPEVPCPYAEIVGLYHDLLPNLPAVRLMDGKTGERRKKAMRSMWGWVLSSSKPDGTRRAEDAEQALQWFRTYFGRASENDFLMGRTPRGAGHEGWRCDLDFLLSDAGMKQVIEKTQAAA